MKFLIVISVCVSFSLRFCNSSSFIQGRVGLIQNANYQPQPNVHAGNRQGNIHAGNRQGVGGGGLSFVIPGLSLLAGNNNGGNLFGPATVTRTIVSTVSTVTTASFRTCVTSAAGLMPCAAGRRKREVTNGVPFEKIEPTPAMALVIGSTTINNREAVDNYLEVHKACTQSVIFPPGVQPFDLSQVNSENVELQSSGPEFTTPLYPSQDTPEATTAANSEIENYNVGELTASETPNLLFDENSAGEAFGTTGLPVDDEGVEDDRGRVGLGRTTTVTTVIRVTSVATSIATGGAMATLTISYMGCMPPSLPISSPVCVM